MSPNGNAVSFSSLSVDGEWVQEGELEIPAHWAPPFEFAVMEKNTLLLLASSQPFVLGNKASSFAMATREAGLMTFRLQKLVQIFPEQPYKRFAEPGPGVSEIDPLLFSWAPAEIGVANALYQGCALIPLENQVVVVTMSAGRIWILDMKGEIKGQFDLLQRLGFQGDPNMPFLGRAILAEFTTPSGELLLVSRNRQWAERKSQVKLTTLPMAMTEDERPLIWWNYNPADGTLRRLNAPPLGGPSMLPTTVSETAEWIRNFPWVLTPTGFVTSPVF